MSNSTAVSAWDKASGNVIGQGGWGAFQSIFSGGNGIIYAISNEGMLLQYQDLAQNGTGSLSADSGKVVGPTGWQAFKSVFASSNGKIYAITTDGNLLSWQPPSPLNPNSFVPSAGNLIGPGQWKGFLAVCAGADGVIYAISPDGNLHWYQDLSQGSNQSWALGSSEVIGFGGWNQFQNLFASSNRILIPVCADGSLRYYQEQFFYGQHQFLPLSAASLGSLPGSDSQSLKLLCIGDGMQAYYVTADGNLHWARALIAPSNAGPPQKCVKVNFGGSTQYDSGQSPAVSANDSGVLVEVHQSGNNSGLWYHLGRLQNGAITWNDSLPYDNGVTPSVALNDSGVVVEVHKSQNNDGLWYHVGRVQGAVINFSQSVQYDNGQTPSVALNDSGVVVEVHKSQNNDGLWYHVGQVQGAVIAWGPSVQYDNGQTPALALDANNLLIEVHQSQNNDGMWYHTGLVDPGALHITFTDSYNYDNGHSPAVAVSSGLVIEAHKSQSADTLWCHLGPQQDTANWMLNTSALAGKKLRNICLPATHDSGTCDLSSTVTPDNSPGLASAIQTVQNIANTLSSVPGIGQVMSDPFSWCLNSGLSAIKGLATATKKTVLSQLRDGMRGLDLRIYRNPADGHFYIHHTLMGDDVAGILGQIRDFLGSTRGEIVYVTMGHPCGLNDSQELEFAAMVRYYLQDYAYLVERDAQNNITNSPFDRTYSDIINQDGLPRSRVILVNPMLPNGYTDPLFWPVSFSPPNYDPNKSGWYIMGGYTNTESATPMLQGQTAYQAAARGSGAPYALYMTLTPSENSCIQIVANSLLGQIAAFTAPLYANPLTAVVAGLIDAAIAAYAVYSSINLPWRTLKDLSQYVDPALASFVRQIFAAPTPPNDISILYLDFYETTDVFNLALSLTLAGS